MKLTPGRALITRLASIPALILNAADKPSPKVLSLAREAALQAIPLIKESTWDTVLYNRLCRQIEATLRPDTYQPLDEGMEVDYESSKLGPESEGGRDGAWSVEAHNAAKAEENRLLVELNGYLSNLIKESIRVRPSLATITL